MKRLITQAAVIVVLPLTLVVPTNAQTGAQTQATLDDLLKLVPDDAALVVALPSFTDAVAGVQAFGAAAGIEEFAEVDAETLFDEMDVGALPDEWRQRVRKGGPFVFAMHEPETEPLLICTVSEPPETPPGELIELRGNVLIVALEPEAMQAVKQASGKFAQRFERQGRPVLKQHDLAVFINIPAWSSRIEQMLAMAQMFAQMGTQMGAPTTTTQAAQVNAAMVDGMFKALQVGLEEAEAVAIAVRLNADGAHVSKLVHFKPGRVADYLKKVGKSDEDPLRGLRAEPGKIILAGEWKLPADVATLSEKMLEAMLAASPAKPDDEEWQTTLQKAMTLYREIPGYNGVVDFVDEPPVMNMSGLYLTDKPQAVLDGFPALWDVSKPMMQALAPGFSMEVSDEKETVGSVAAQVYRFKFEVDDENTQRLLKAIYGESATCYVAPHPAGVAYTVGSPAIARKNLEKLLAGKGAALARDRRVAAALKALSPKPQALMLCDLPGFMKWAMQLASSGIAGGPAPAMPVLKLPDKPAPYLAFGLYLHETACGAEVFLSAETLKVLVDAFKEAGGEAPTSEPY